MILNFYWDCKYVKLALHITSLIVPTPTTNLHMAKPYVTGKVIVKTRN